MSVFEGDVQKCTFPLHQGSPCGCVGCLVPVSAPCGGICRAGRPLLFLWPLPLLYLPHVHPLPGGAQLPLKEVRLGKLLEGHRGITEALSSKQLMDFFLSS